jgi:F-box/WD-40 domain protein 7
MWDIGSGECLHVLVGHVAAVRCVQYDGRLVVSGAYDYMVKVTVLPPPPPPPP